MSHKGSIDVNVAYRGSGELLVAKEDRNRPPLMTSGCADGMHLQESSGSAKQIDIIILTPT